MAIWQEWRPHLIWMDMRMPVMDGREATRRIKASPQGKETIIIALTASGFEEEREEIVALGGEDFVRKPFREDVLFGMLRKHLGVDFIHEKESADAARLLEAPAELRTRLVEALMELDIDAVAAAIESIRDYDVNSAEMLAALAKRF